MKKVLLSTILGFLLMMSPVFALNVSVSVDKTRVLLGESFTLTGKITHDNGLEAIFDYRAAVVAPKGIIICDSNKTKTKADGTFQLVCQTPTKEKANSLGIPASLERSVISLRTGVAVRDPEKNVTIKRHTSAVLAVNPDKFKARVNELASHISNFVRSTNAIISECDKLIERSERFNVTTVSERCQAIKDKVNALVADANNISGQAKQLSENINASDLEDFKAGLSIIKDDMKSLRDNLKDMRDRIKEIRWENLKEVKREVRQSIKETRQEIKEEIKSKREDLRERIKQVRSKTEREVSR